MKKTTLVLLVSTIVALILAWSLVIPVFATGSQSWNLDSHLDQDVLDPPTLCQMERTFSPGDNGQSGQILLTPNTSQIWIANEMTPGNVTFGGGDGAWILELVTDNTWQTDGTDCIVRIGEWDGRRFRPFLSALQDNPPLVVPISGNPTQFIITFVWQNVDETVRRNCYLAIEVTNRDSASHTVFCGENQYSSCLTSTGYNPGYPAPPSPPTVPAASEIGTGLMVGGITGLLFLILKARQKRI